jgi:transcriptional regulator
VYLPKHFQVDDLQILAKLIAEYPLATLVGNLGEHLEVNHLPLILSADGKNCMGISLEQTH